MKNISIILLILVFGESHLSAQNKLNYHVLDTPKTIITIKPLFLNVKDTLNNHITITPVSDCLGGLIPRYPMAISHEFLYSAIWEVADCLDITCVFSCECKNYLIEKNDSIIEINSKEKFKEIFAPVENREEALSFAFALYGGPGIAALYDFKFLRDKGTDYEFFREEIRPTSVKEVPGGFEVILFGTYWGSTSNCSEELIFVSTQGDVKLLKSEGLFNDKNFKLIFN